MTFKNLRIAFMEQEYTQADVARYLGISSPTMSCRMNGKEPWRMNEVEKLMKLLDIAPEQLYDYFAASAQPDAPHKPKPIDREPA